MGKKELLKTLADDGFSQNIIDAFAAVPREKFVPLEYRYEAYEDIALPLEAAGATISQPYTIAFMLHLLEFPEKGKILEIGAGSGYVLALLAQLMPKVKIHGVEVQEELVKDSKKRLAEQKNIFVHHTDGKQGLIRHAPYDCIIASAAFPEIPHHLLDQLKVGGVLVVPVGHSIYRLQKSTEGITERKFPGFVFVQMK